MGPIGGRGNKRLVAEINVTPLVDVMLVLLIIFMVTAPMMTQGLEVDLPKTTAKSLRQHETPLVVTVNAKGEIYLGKIMINSSLLRQQLSRLPEEKKQQPLYLRADKNVPYGLVVTVMADIKRAGFEKLGMITTPPEERK
ncbi:MAG TPA: protein TolR [Desulfobulbus sp.]|nr:protein TolR [Desulfobulbus sp.]